MPRNRYLLTSFVSHTLSNGQVLRSNEIPGGDTDIVIHKNESTLRTYNGVFVPDFTPTDILEIGVKEGGSLVLWKELFPKAAIMGVDISIKQMSNAYLVYASEHEWLMTVISADVSKPSQAHSIVYRLSPVFDLIIDDGPHTLPEIPDTFSWAWPMLRSGGIYAIEDYKALHHTHQEELKRHLIDVSGGPLELYPNMIVIRKP